MLRRGGKGLKMDFLLSHWHCWAPLVIIAAVLILGKRKHRDEEK
jgi:hypothetical protein